MDAPLGTPPPHAPMQPRGWSGFWRGFLTGIVTSCLIGCVVGAVGLRARVFALPNGMSSPILSPAPDGYLIRQPAEVDFLTISRSKDNGAHGGMLYRSGTFYRAASVSGHFQQVQSDWIGTQSDEHLTILFPKESTKWNAIWHGASLLVTYQQANYSQFVTDQFDPASTSDFNHAIAALQQSSP